MVGLHCGSWQVPTAMEKGGWMGSSEPSFPAPSSSLYPFSPGFHAWHLRSESWRPSWADLERRLWPGGRRARRLRRCVGSSAAWSWSFGKSGALVTAGSPAAARIAGAWPRR